MTYKYQNKVTFPNLDQIHIDITQSGSGMIDQSIEWCRWDEDISELCIYFTNTLDAEDKTELDTIVTNNS